MNEPSRKSFVWIRTMRKSRRLLSKERSVIFVSKDVISVVASLLAIYMVGLEFDQAKGKFQRRVLGAKEQFRLINSNMQMPGFCYLLLCRKRATSVINFLKNKWWIFTSSNFEANCWRADKGHRMFSTFHKTEPFFQKNCPTMQTCFTVIHANDTHHNFSFSLTLS